MYISDFKDKLFKKASASGFESCEIYYSSSESFKVSVYNAKLEKFQNRSSSGFGFRGLYNGKMGYYFSESLDESIIDDVVKNAMENAEILTSDEKQFIFEGSDKYSNVNVYDASIDALSVEDKMNMAMDMERLAKEYSDKIKAVNTSMISTGEGYVYIANTKGMELKEKSNYFMAYLEVMAENDGSVKEKGEIYMGSPEKFSIKDIVKTACDKTIGCLNGKVIKSGKIKTIIKNEAFADLISCFVGNFYAENVQKGFSLLKGRLNENIASDIITLSDEPLMDNGYMTTAFDSEGVASYNKNIIENGKLCTFLYNMKSANVDGVKSTGNGFKPSFKNTVSTSHTNLYIKNGTKSFDNMVKDVNDGVVITDVTGLHAGANSVSGDFSLSAEGYKIENGVVTYPVEQITVAGNFYNVLKDVIDIGNDLKFNTSAVGSPSVIVELDIAGL